MQCVCVLVLEIRAGRTGRSPAVSFRSTFSASGALSSAQGFVRVMHSHRLNGQQSKRWGCVCV